MSKIKIFSLTKNYKILIKNININDFLLKKLVFYYFYMKQLCMVVLLDNKDDRKIVVEAVVLEISSNGNCKVQIDNGKVVNAYVSGSLRQQPGQKNKIVVQDKVIIEFAKEDTTLSKARIVKKIQNNATGNRTPGVKRSFSARKIHKRPH